MMLHNFKLLRDRYFSQKRGVLRFVSSKKQLRIEQLYFRMDAEELIILNNEFSE